jgi:hypothetical protein
MRPFLETAMIRALVCGGVLASFFEGSPEDRKLVIKQIHHVFGDWEKRFGIKVLGSLDDDRLQIGPTLGYPWTFYILCDAPDHETLVTVVDQLRQGDFPLYKYIKLEVRMGRAATELGLP